MRTRHNNSFDYVAQIASAIEANAPHASINSTSNEALIAGEVSLANYDAVVWFSGEESSADDSFNGAEQTLVTDYLAAGGKLFVSGAEIAWDLDNLNNGRQFYNDQLKADYVSDDANTHAVQGVVGSIFAGLSFSFDDGSIFYDAQFPDRIAPSGGSTLALNYVGGSGGGAATQFDGGATQVVNFGFPFETITTAADRSAVMDRVLEFFGLGQPTADYNSDHQVNGADFLAWQRGFGITTNAQLTDGDANGNGTVDGDDLATWQQQLGQAAAPLQTTASLEATHDAPSAFDDLLSDNNALAGLAQRDYVASGSFEGDLSDASVRSSSSSDTITPVDATFETLGQFQLTPPESFEPNALPSQAKTPHEALVDQGPLDRGIEAWFRDQWWFLSAE